MSTSQLPSCEVLLMAPDQKITRATSVVTKHWLDMAGCSQEQSRMNLLSACVLDFACRIFSKEPSSAACPAKAQRHITQSLFSELTRCVRVIQSLITCVAMAQQCAHMCPQQRSKDKAIQSILSCMDLATSSCRQNVDSSICCTLIC